MTTPTLVEFLRARLDEDERMARHVWPERYTARVLADIEAKRRIADLHSGYVGICGWTHDPNTSHNDELPCETLRALALPYADHPDYDERWEV